jgi:DNA-binding MarR family transcriptional regulator
MVKARRSLLNRQPEALGLRIATGLAKIGLALKHQGIERASSRGISPTQAQILTLLANAPAGLRPSALADQLAVSHPTVTDSARVLVEKGMVEKVSDPADARATRLKLTSSGVTEARHAASWPDFLAGAVDAMAEREQEVFYGGLVKMIRTLQERGQIPLTGMCLTCHHFEPHAHAGSELPHHCHFVDAPIGVRALRLDCPDHEPAPEEVQQRLWRQFQQR